MAEARSVNMECAAEVVTLEEKQRQIIKLLSYYFGDINMSRDKFMKELMVNHDGWIPFSKLMTFNRLAKLTTNPNEVVEAIKEANSQLLEVTGDGRYVRRSPDFPVPVFNSLMKHELMSKTIYVKGFPENVTMDDLLKYYEDYNPDNIIMRKYKNATEGVWLFKGSIFVTFKSTADAQSYFNDKSKLRYEDHNLSKEWQSTYVNSKRVHREVSKFLREKSLEEEIYLQLNVNLPHGAILLFTGIPPEASTEEIKIAITDLGGDVKFVHIMEDRAWVRLNLENSAIDVNNKCNGIVHLGYADIKCRVLDGVEETLYLNNVKSEIIMHKLNKQRKRDKKYQQNKKRLNTN